MIRHRDLAAVCAQHAAIALAGDESVRKRREAVSARDTIGQAKGIIMERYGMTPDTAFAVLTRVFRPTNLKLWDVAAWSAAAKPCACLGRPHRAG